MKKIIALALIAVLGLTMFTGCHARRGHIVEHNGLNRPAVTHHHKGNMVDMQDGFVDSARDGIYRTEGPAFENAYNRNSMRDTTNLGQKRAANPDPFFDGDVLGR